MIYIGTSAGTSSGTNGGNWISLQTSTSSGTVTAYDDAPARWISNAAPPPAPSFRHQLLAQSSIDLNGWKGDLALPDGSKIEIDAHGNYQIVEANRQVKYRAHWNREFNRYLNASDLLEEFIGEAGRAGVKKSDVLDGLFGVFVHWLILKAAERDGDDVPDDIRPIAEHPALPQPVSPGHCRVCGRFVTKQAIKDELPFCGERHLVLFFSRKWRRE